MKRLSSIACALLAGFTFLHSTTGVHAAVVITTQQDVTGQLTNDDLQGIIPTVKQNTMTAFGGGAALTDAPTFSPGTYFDTDALNGVLVFDMGNHGRSLLTVHIWLNGRDPFRRNTHIQLAVSADDVTYTPIADSGLQIFPATSSTNTYNLLSFNFDNGDVSGFRYLQVTGIPVAQPHDSVVRHPRWAEIDAILSVPEPGTAVFTIFGLLALHGAHRAMRQRKSGAKQ